MRSVAKPPLEESAPDAGRRLRVVIGDGDPIARRVMRDVLQEAGVIVVAEADNGRDAVDLALHYRPEILLMEAKLPGIDGVSAMERVLARTDDVRVVIISASCDAEVGLRSLRAGASGFLTKDIDIQSLSRTLGRVAEGEIACSRFFVSALVNRLRAAPQRGIGMRPVKSKLTPREWEVLDLLCEGSATATIADQLFLSTETVRSHVKNLMRKLGVRSRQEAIALAPQLRLGALEGAGDEPAETALRALEARADGAAEPRLTRVI